MCVISLLTGARTPPGVMGSTAASRSKEHTSVPQASSTDCVLIVGIDQYKRRPKRFFNRNVSSKEIHREQCCCLKGELEVS